MSLVSEKTLSYFVLFTVYFLQHKTHCFPFLFQEDSTEDSWAGVSVGKNPVIFLLFYKNASLTHIDEKAAVERFSWLKLLGVGVFPWKSLCGTMSCVPRVRVFVGLSHAALQSWRGPWQSVGSTDNWNAPIKVDFVDISCMWGGRLTTEQVNYAWLTHNFLTSPALLPVLTHRAIQTANTTVHKPSHATCLGELCYALKQPFFSKSPEIPHWVSYSLEERRFLRLDWRCHCHHGV